MNFEIQALGGKLIGSRSALKTLDRLTTLLPNAKINFEVIPPLETKKAEFGSMPNFRVPVPDEDDITLADLKEQLEDNMTLAEIQKEFVKVEAAKKRLKKENYKNYENYEEKKETFEFVDEMTYHSRTSDHLPNF